MVGRPRPAAGAAPRRSAAPPSVPTSNVPFAMSTIALRRRAALVLGIAGLTACSATTLAAPASAAPPRPTAISGTTAGVGQPIAVTAKVSTRRKRGTAAATGRVLLIGSPVGGGKRYQLGTLPIPALRAKESRTLTATFRRANWRRAATGSHCASGPSRPRTSGRSASSATSPCSPFRTRPWLSPSPRRRRRRHRRPPRRRPPPPLRRRRRSRPPSSRWRRRASISAIS